MPRPVFITLLLNLSFFNLWCHRSSPFYDDEMTFLSLFLIAVSLFFFLRFLFLYIIYLFFLWNILKWRFVSFYLETILLLLCKSLVYYFCTDKWRSVIFFLFLPMLLTTLFLYSVSSVLLCLLSNAYIKCLLLIICYLFFFSYFSFVFYSTSFRYSLLCQCVENLRTRPSGTSV